MEDYNVHNRKFKAVSNVVNGDVDEQTIFHYRQHEKIIWATYEGGAIIFGTLSGFIKGNKMTFVYQHQNLSGSFMTGKCETTISQSGGKLHLSERWQWTCGDQSTGTSELVEMKSDE